MEHSTRYTLGFAAIVAVAASAVVATAAVVLSARQEANRLLDRRAQVLEVFGLSEPGESLSRAEVSDRFARNVRALLIELETGDEAVGVDVEAFDQARASRDPRTSRQAPENRAGIARVPEHVVVHELVRDGDVQALALPFEGVGLWSTMYGYIALSADLSTVVGITVYEHAETAGLGALVSDPTWRALWVGRRMFNPDWEPSLRVVKGAAGPPQQSPYEVDGLAGATLTGNGVNEALRFWLGPDGLGPYLARYRAERGIR